MSATPIKVMIVDDEAPARHRLRALLADIAAELPNEVVGEVENGAEALRRLVMVPAEVVLVDIRMPVMDGIELAQHVTRLEHPPAIVFTTAYDQYAVNAFELNAVDYLLKPVRSGRLLAALQKARRAAPGLPPQMVRELLPEGRQHLSCNERGRILLVPVSDILYLRAELKYVTARTLEREFLLEESLTQLEQEFPRRFIRVHRNCLVARTAVSGFERDQAAGEGHWLVLLKGLAEKLPVSRRQWSAVKAALAETGRE
jgi:two-component system response regulator AlgR